MYVRVYSSCYTWAERKMCGFVFASGYTSLRFEGGVEHREEYAF